MNFSFYIALLLALFAPGTTVHIISLYVLVSGTHCSCVWVLPVEYRILVSREERVLLTRNAWFDSGYMYCISAWWLLNELPIFYGEVDSDPDVLSPFRCRMEKSAQPMLQIVVSLEKKKKKMKQRKEGKKQNKHEQ